MDPYTTDQLTEREIPTPRPEVDPVWREELERAVELADEAARATPAPEPAPPEQGRSYVGAGQPMTAPAAERAEVEPSSVSAEDGYVAAPREEIIRQLENATFAELRVKEVPVVLEETPEARPLRIVYVFERPVTAAEGVSGELLVIDDEGAEVPFEPGVPARRLVQKIDEASYGREAQPDGQAWTCEVRFGNAGPGSLLGLFPTFQRAVRTAACPISPTL